jgi:hypothetical protein
LSKFFWSRNNTSAFSNKFMNINMFASNVSYGTANSYSVFPKC